MTISVSIERILESVYARAALDAAVSGTERPPLLDRSHEAALRRLARDCMARLLSEMGSVVAGSSLGESDDASDIITVEAMIDHSSALASTFRMSLETAIVCAVLAEAFVGVAGPAERYAAMSRMSASPLPPRLRRAV